jgi:hypothetical protein
MRDMKKGRFIRQLIERERKSERELELLKMFNEAAADVTAVDREERESLLGAFVGSSCPPIDIVDMF